MKLMTFYTPSHAEMYNNWFMRSLREVGFPEKDLITVGVDEQLGSGTFRSPGFCETATKKVWAISNQLWEMDEGDILVFSDCDIQFFQPFMPEIEKKLEGADLVAQADMRGFQFICAGFVGMRVTDAMRLMWQFVGHSTPKYPHAEQDQSALNEHKGMVTVDILSRRYWTTGLITMDYWTGWDFEIPEDIIMHHATFAIGIENKIVLMNKVREKVYNRRDKH